MRVAVCWDRPARPGAVLKLPSLPMKSLGVATFNINGILTAAKTARMVPRIVAGRGLPARAQDRHSIVPNRRH